MSRVPNFNNFNLHLIFNYLKKLDSIATLTSKEIEITIFTQTILHF